MLSSSKAIISRGGGSRSLLLQNLPTASTINIHRLKSSGCPVSPILTKVPSLPFVGSMIPQHSGVPEFNMNRQYQFNNEMRKKYGEFIKFGLPGFGVGLYGDMYTIFDPNEMAKVVRSEGAYPSGLIEKLWQWRRAMLESGSVLVSKKESSSDGESHDYGLFDKGEGWKRHRSFLQTGMLDPVAAKGFLPGIVVAAENASSVAPLHAHDVNEYLNYTAFDMFCSFMFGQQVREAMKFCGFTLCLCLNEDCLDTNPSLALILCLQMNTTSTVVSTDPNVRGENIENERFVTAALGVFDKTNAMNLFPFEFLLAKFLPWYKTKKFQALQNDWETVREVGLKKIYDFVDRYDKNELDEMEKASYLAGAIERQRESNDITRDEMAELCLIALFVGVDTTSSVTAWNLLHLALNPECQEKLHAELLESLNEKGSNGGTRLNADVIGKKVSPYLHMCFRESHRATPAFGAAMWKGNSHSDVEIYGETLPRGSMVQMGHLSYDEEYIEEPKQFRPERWTADGVASRKGTKSEVLDHPLLRDPFSQGARRCPGSRVATNEILAMISQLVLDWKISVCDESIKSLEDIKHEAGPIKPIFPALSFEARHS